MKNFSSLNGTKVYSTKEALSFAKENISRQWNIGPNSAKNRFDENLRMTVNHKPKFKINSDEKVFTIGSCFAREIEMALQRHKVPLLLAGHGVIAEKYESWRDDTQTGGGVKAGIISRGVFNKYTTHSMLFDIERAITDRKWPNEGLIELADGKWFDPHAAGLAITDKESALKNRAAVDAGLRTINEADVVIITLGLTESWMENNNGLVMNRAPSGAYLVKKSDLFSFIDFGYEDVVNVLGNLIDTIKMHRGEKIKIVITVSPVPSSTFSDKDVVQASVGSKSILRAAAETVSRKNEFVDYFPSYEMVTLSPRSLAWKEDSVHVQPDMVKHVINTFMNAYYS